jgi:hypothetical protein
LLSYYSYPKNYYYGFSNHLLLAFTIQEFDNIYNIEIAKRNEKHEIKRLSYKQKENRKRKYDAIGRIFQDGFKR